MEVLKADSQATIDTLIAANDALVVLVDGLKKEKGDLVAHIRLAEHKVDQHLQGQYNELPYPALGVALASLRKALLILKADTGQLP